MVFQVMRLGVVIDILDPWYKSLYDSCEHRAMLLRSGGCGGCGVTNVAVKRRMVVVKLSIALVVITNFNALT